MPPPPCPLAFLNINIKLDLIQRVFKSKTSETQFRSIAMEAAEVSYPGNDWLCVFSGSAMLDLTHSALAGIHCEFFHFHPSTVPYTTAFHGEIEAIIVVVQHVSIRAHLFEKVVISPDSKSVLQILINKQINFQRIMEC